MPDLRQEGPARAALAYAYGALPNSSTVDLRSGPAVLRFGSSQVLRDVAYNGATGTFTVSDSGAYRVTVMVNITTPYFGGLLGFVNNAYVEELDYTPTSARDHFAVDAVLRLDAGDALTLRMSGSGVTLEGTYGQAGHVIIQQLS